MKRKAVIVCLLLALPAGAQQGGDQEGKLVALEKMWNQAQIARDSNALQSLIANKFVDTEYDGEVSNHDKFLADIRDPEYKPTAMNIEEVKVNLYRDTAVVTGIYHTKGTYNRKPYDHLGRFTDTWIFEGGRWQCVASHTSLIKN